MLNQVVLVGRLTKDPEITTTESGKKYLYITLAVQRPFKNVNGIYDTDFIRCVLWNAIADSAAEYTKTGDVIGVKGRIQVENYEDDEGNMKYVTNVIAEKISFLSSAKTSIEEG